MPYNQLITYLPPSNIYGHANMELT